VLRTRTFRGFVAVVMLVAFSTAAASATSALSRHHRRNHHSNGPAPASVTTGSASITIVPNVIKLTGTGAFTASINGAGLPVGARVSINTASLDAVCSGAGIRPKLSFGAAIPSSATAGTDGRFAGSLAGVGCRPGAYAVAVQEQDAPYQTLVAVLTLTL